MNPSQYIPKLTLDELAQLMTVDYLCEHCRKMIATELFDRAFVCSSCRRSLEERLVRHG